MVPPKDDRENLVLTRDSVKPRASGTLDGARGPFTFVSGPSATSDIELDRAEAVRGTRRLAVLLV